jgi:hypothetical protein
MEEEPLVAGQAADPLEGGGLDGVDGVGRQGDAEPGVEGVALGHLPEHGLLLAPGLLAVAEIDEDGADVGPEPHLLHGTGHAGVVPVHVVEVGGPAADHLEAGQAGAVVDVVLGEACLGGPDPGAQPVHEGQVVAPPPEEGHGGVGVAVAQGGEGVEAGGVDDALDIIRPTWRR